MALKNHHQHYHLSTIITAFSVLLFFFVSTANTLSHIGSGAMMTEEGRTPYGDRVIMNEKRLRGPGSSPPSCRSKCEKCSPCKPVHVPIHPSLSSMSLEYYPQAWRCKCGNQIFMP